MKFVFHDFMPEIQKNNPPNPPIARRKPMVGSVN